MIIKLFDHTEITVSKAQGEIVKEFLKSDDSIIEVAGFILRRGTIAYLKPGGFTQADIEHLDKIERPSSSGFRVDEPASIKGILEGKEL